MKQGPKVGKAAWSGNFGQASLNIQTARLIDTGTDPEFGILGKFLCQTTKRQFPHHEEECPPHTALPSFIVLFIKVRVFDCTARST